MMAMEYTKHNTACQTGVHTEHLCYIISQGFHLSDEENYKVLVEYAEYKCRRCGRVAKSDANLCLSAPL